jgi:hypothetical protein
MNSKYELRLKASVRLYQLVLVLQHPALLVKAKQEVEFSLTIFWCLGEEGFATAVVPCSSWYSAMLAC